MTNDSKWREIGRLEDENADLKARLADEEREHEQTLKERDDTEEMADKLAAALATLLGVEIGEHSSGNCPWLAALEAFEEHPPSDLAASERDAARYRWLRGRNELTGSMDPAGPFVIETDRDDNVHYPTGKQIDAAVDAAIAADSASEMTMPPTTDHT